MAGCVLATLAYVTPYHPPRTQLSTLNSCVKTTELRDVPDPSPNSLAAPFHGFTGGAMVLTGFGVVAFSSLRRTRPRGLPIRLEADPLQEAMDGAHRIYVHE